MAVCQRIDHSVLLVIKVILGAFDSRFAVFVNPVCCNNLTYSNYTKDFVYLKFRTFVLGSAAQTCLLMSITN